MFCSRAPPPMKIRRANQPYLILPSGMVVGREGVWQEKATLETELRLLAVDRRKVSPVSPGDTVRTTASLKCEAVPRRARIQGS